MTSNFCTLVLSHLGITLFSSFISCRWPRQVLFWGMRNLKRLMLLNVNSPKIYIEFGGYHLESDMIVNVEDRANFRNRVKHIDVVSFLFYM